MFNDKTCKPTQIIMKKNNGDSTQYLIKWIENNKEECNWVESRGNFS